MRRIRTSFPAEMTHVVPKPECLVCHADATVAALMAALRDIINGHPAVTGVQAARLHAASALLAALEEK